MDFETVMKNLKIASNNVSVFLRELDAVGAWFDERAFQ